MKLQLIQFPNHQINLLEFVRFFFFLLLLDFLSSDNVGSKILTLHCHIHRTIQIFIEPLFMRLNYTSYFNFVKVCKSRCIIIICNLFK